MSDDKRDIVVFELPDNAWHLVDPFGTVSITVKNYSDTSVSVYKTMEEIAPDLLQDYLTSRAINPPELGGLLYETSTMDGERIYARCNEDTGRVHVRLYGTIDPETDVTSLGESLNNLKMEYQDHLMDHDNPHQVTKEQVGLGNIPNVLVDDIHTEDWTDVTDHMAMASLRGVRQVYIHSKNHTDITNGNPHGTTKLHVGLGNVANYPPATKTSVLDTDNDQAYLTPYTANLLIRDITLVASSMDPQMVIRGSLGSRPNDWASEDMSLPSNTVLKAGARKITVDAGLQVSFAYQGVCRMSKILEQPINYDFPSNIGTGHQYVYVDLAPSGDFLAVGYSPHVPVTSAIQASRAGDLFNTSTYEVVDVEDNELNRVYIAKVYFQANSIISITCVPIGNEALVPVLQDLEQGVATYIDNPFLAPVEATAYVRVNDKWAESRWNDQIGVIASPRPGYESTQIVVQAGLMGYVTKGSSSGTALGSNFVTVTLPPRTAVKLKKIL